MTKAVGLLVLTAACSVARPHEIPPTAGPGREPSVKPLHAGGASTTRAERIDAVMERWAHEDSPGCAVAVIQGGEFIHAKGYGMAALEHAVPVTPDTVFEIASTSKQFTASAVLLAAADGALGLDDVTGFGLALGSTRGLLFDRVP